MNTSEISDIPVNDFYIYEKGELFMFSQQTDSPVGVLTVICDDSSLLRIEFGEINEKSESNEVTQKVVCQLNEYFNGTRKSFDIPLALSGTDFQIKVWNELLKILYGKVCTYGDIAKSIGNAKASRAVGGANNKNPIPIIIPCHRVVAFNGIGGYGPGVELKKILLDIEKNNSGSV